MDNDLHLEVRSDPRLLGAVRQMVRAWVESCELSSESAHELVLAIDEACSNAFRHAYHGRCDRSVELTLRADPEYLEVRLCDQGDPCPPEKLQRRELDPSDPEQLEPGGLGIHLMHQVFDEVDFCPGVESGNCIVMRRKRER